MTEPSNDLTAVDRVNRGDGRRRLIVIGLILILPVIALSFVLQLMRISRPIDQPTDEMYFRYGSIGSDVEGVPYWVFRVLPDICPSQLPGGYASLGVIQEPGQPTPIGFSRRQVGPVEIVGPNCGLCHTASVRAAPSSQPMIITTAPAHQLNLMGYFKFLFSCGRSDSFTADNVIPAIEKYKPLNLLERITYRYVVMPQLQKALADKGKKFDSIIAGRPEWGYGRVDTFNPYKVLVFNLDMSNDKSIGTARFMSVWNQQEQQGAWHHWDGNNDSLEERNLSAAIGAGVVLDPPSFDWDGLERIKGWLWNKPPPKYPFPIDLALANTGKPIYDKLCKSCHDPAGEHFGSVTPLNKIGTDPDRSLAFDKAMADRMNTIGQGQPWGFHRFRSTGGYGNHSLEGIWVRAPYLHNGSVPTLDDLLKAPDKRPTKFYTGYDVYDPKHVGFVGDVPREGSRTFIEFDTSLPGNHNSGHVYGAEMSDADRTALLEYLKTL